MDSNLKEIKLFYASLGIFNFATSIIEIFIPLYFLDKGFSVSSILLFFALTQLGRFVFLPLGAWLSCSFGAKKIMSMAFVLSIVFYMLLREISDLSFNFYFSSVFYGMIQAFLWLTILVHLSKISPDKDKGKIVGRLSVYTAIASATCPVLGGLVIAAYGFSSAFLLVVLLIIPSIFLLLITPERSKIRKIHFGSVNIKKVYPDLIANGFFNFQEFLGLIVWPIFIFIILPQYNTIGFIQTIALFVSIIAFHFIGNLTDKVRRKKILFYGSMANSAVSISRVFASSFASIFLFNTASIFTKALQDIPWSVKVQEHMEKESRTEYAAIFEMGGALVTFAGLLIFMFAIQLVSLKDALIYGIIISSVSGLFVNLIRK